MINRDTNVYNRDSNNRVSFGFISEIENSYCSCFFRCSAIRACNLFYEGDSLPDIRVEPGRYQMPACKHYIHSRERTQSYVQLKQSAHTEFLQCVYRANSVLYKLLPARVSF